VFALSVGGTLLQSVCRQRLLLSVVRRQQFLVAQQFWREVIMEPPRSSSLPPKLWSGRETHKTKPQTTPVRPTNTTKKKEHEARACHYSLCCGQWHDDFHHHHDDALMCRWSPLIGADFICEQELGQCPCPREAASMTTSRPKSKCREAIGFGFIAACRWR
jgi:hypothetical protein